MKKLTIIPARSGSKGVPNKNILQLGNIPMFAWSIIHALYYSTDEDLIVVSSESDTYLQIAEEYGAIPHKRPNYLAEDETKTEPVMDDVIESFNINNEDIIILLQPTSPIRKKITLDLIIKAFDDESCNSALTLHNFHGFLWKNLDQYKVAEYSQRPRRQDMEPMFIETGSVYATRYCDYLSSANRVSGNIKGIEVGFEEALEVDTKEEFEVISSHFLNA